MQTLGTAPATPQSRPLEHFLPEMQHFKNYSTHARRKNACRHIFNWIPPLALFSTWEILMHYRDPPTLFHGNVETSEAILPPCDDHSQFPDARVMRNRTVSVRELCKIVGSFDNKHTWELLESYTAVDLENTRTCDTPTVPKTFSQSTKNMAAPFKKTQIEIRCFERLRCGDYRLTSLRIFPIS